MGPRRAKRGVWGRVAWATLALGVVCDAVLWGVWAPLGSMFAAAVIAFSFAVLVGRSLRASTLLGVGSAVVLAGCVGLVAAFGWAGAVLVLMLAATSPLTQRVLPMGGRGPGAVQPGRAGTGDGHDTLDGPGVSFPVGGGSLSAFVPLAGMPGADGVPALDDHGLCEAWRRSYVRLQASRAAGARLEVVRLRQVYLDELVRRHPAEVRRWLESGARAAGNPLPFLERTEHRRQGTPEDGQPDRGGSEAA